MAFYLVNRLQILPGKSSGVLSGIHSDPTGAKLGCCRFAGFGSVMSRPPFFFACLLVFTHRMEEKYDIYIAYIFMFGTGHEPGQAAGTLDMRSCAPSISTWHFGTLLRPPGNLKWGPNAYPTKKPSPTKLHSCGRCAFSAAFEGQLWRTGYHWALGAEAGQNVFLTG